MPANLHSVALAQPFLRDGARGDADRGLARRGATTAAVVAQAILLPVRVVRVAGPEGIGKRAVVLAALVFIPDEKPDRRAGRPAFENPGENFDAVGFHALGNVAR